MKLKLMTLFLLSISFANSWANFTEEKSLIKLSPNPSLHLNLAQSDDLGGGKSHTVTSLILPGVGLWRVTKMPATLVFLPLCYGMVGFGTINIIKGKVEYNNYMAEKNPIEQGTYYDNAIKKNENGRRILGFGVAFWIIQAGWTYIYGSYNDIYRTRNSSWKDKITLHSGGYDPISKSFSLSTSINF